MNNKTNKNKVKIIAEIGVNHNGSVSLAKELIDQAKDCGVDYVKFQTFRAELLTTPQANQAEYQARLSPEQSQLTMLQKLELTSADFVNLQRYCQEHGIGFLSTAFDLPSTNFLHTLQLDYWKIPSGEITNLPYLRQIGQYDQPIILSTGMANLAEIAAALDAIKQAGTNLNKITLLHCTTEYPTPMSEANLTAIVTLRCAFPGLAGVGYSDHTLGLEATIAAVTLGAIIIEKHFTLDRNLPGPDHQASLTPRELRQLVTAVRNLESALGDGVIQPSPGELGNRLVARKSLVAATEVRKGTLWSKDNLTCKRPGTGVSPMLWDHYIGSAAQRDYTADELID